jgi:hypothetical protein
MQFFNKKIIMYALLLIFLIGFFIQGFYNYHNWKVREWCDQFGSSYVELGGPPKSWEWPWNWSMVTSIYVYRPVDREGKLEYQNKVYPEPNIDDARRLIYHARYLSRLTFAMYITLPLTAEDIVALKKNEQIILKTSIPFNENELQNISDNMPKTMVILNAKHIEKSWEK